MTQKEELRNQRAEAGLSLRSVRKDAAEAHTLVIYPDADESATWDSAARRKWANDSYAVISEWLGHTPDAVGIHRDEAGLHMHFFDRCLDYDTDDGLPAYNAKKTLSRSRLKSLHRDYVAGMRKRGHDIEEHLSREERFEKGLPVRPAGQSANDYAMTMELERKQAEREDEERYLWKMERQAAYDRHVAEQDAEHALAMRTVERDRAAAAEDRRHAASDRAAAQAECSDARKDKQLAAQTKHLADGALSAAKADRAAAKMELDSAKAERQRLAAERAENDKLREELSQSLGKAKTACDKADKAYAEAEAARDEWRERKAPNAWEVLYALPDIFRALAEKGPTGLRKAFSKMADYMDKILDNMVEHDYEYRKYDSYKIVTDAMTEFKAENAKGKWAKSARDGAKTALRDAQQAAQPVVTARHRPAPESDAVQVSAPVPMPDPMSVPAVPTTPQISKDWDFGY